MQDGRAYGSAQYPHNICNYYQPKRLAVISADKMNVVYVGFNAITISIPGISWYNVSASAPGLSKQSGK